MSNFKFFNTLKEPISSESLAKNPFQVECTEPEISKIEHEFLPLANSNISKARRELRDLSKSKFFPMSLRPKIWEKLIHNISGISKKLYAMYLNSIGKYRVDGALFGSESVILQSLESYSKESGIVLKPDTVEAIVRMLLIFEYLQPDVGYVIGMERTAFFIHSMVGLEEDTAFIIMYNLYFSGEFLWTTLSAEANLLKHYLFVLKNLVDTYTTCKDMYAVNRHHFERFFVECSQTLFIGVLSPEIIEKLIDYLVIWDDATLFSLMLLIIKSFGNFDLSKFSYSKARLHLLKCAKDIPDHEYIKAIIMTSANHKELREAMSTKAKSN